MININLIKDNSNIILFSEKVCINFLRNLHVILRKCHTDMTQNIFSEQEKSCQCKSKPGFPLMKRYPWPICQPWLNKHYLSIERGPLISLNDLNRWYLLQIIKNQNLKNVQISNICTINCKTRSLNLENCRRIIRITGVPYMKYYAKINR